MKDSVEAIRYYADAIRRERKQICSLSHAPDIPLLHAVTFVNPLCASPYISPPEALLIFFCSGS